MAPEIAGPQEHWMPDMVKSLAKRRGDRRPVLRVSVPGKIGGAMAGGALLPHGPGPRGTIGFQDWLEAEGAGR